MFLILVGYICTEPCQLFPCSQCIFRTTGLQSKRLFCFRIRAAVEKQAFGERDILGQPLFFSMVCLRVLSCVLYHLPYINFPQVKLLVNLKVSLITVVLMIFNCMSFKPDMYKRLTVLPQQVSGLNSNSPERFCKAVDQVQKNNTSHPSYRLYIGSSSVFLLRFLFSHIEPCRHQHTALIYSSLISPVGHFRLLTTANWLSFMLN